MLFGCQLSACSYARALSLSLPRESGLEETEMILVSLESGSTDVLYAVGQARPQMRVQATNHRGAAYRKQPTNHALAASPIRRGQSPDRGGDRKFLPPDGSQERQCPMPFEIQRDNHRMD